MNELHLSHVMIKFDHIGKGYRAQFQLGNGALLGASYFQSMAQYLSLGREVFWVGQHQKFGVDYATLYNTDKMVDIGQVASTKMVLLQLGSQCDDKKEMIKTRSLQYSFLRENI
ncbi:Mitochondrial import receptor subunit TOM40-1 [Spatholobus suberectus]|nr:Mitochondrial import receptor subunit TOM40-1 [Spatholobus suberectus]